MAQEYAKKIREIRSFEKGDHRLCHTYLGSLYGQSSWFLHSRELELGDFEESIDIKKEEKSSTLLAQPLVEELENGPAGGLQHREVSSDLVKNIEERPFFNLENESQIKENSHIDSDDGGPEFPNFEENLNLLFPHFKKEMIPGMQSFCPETGVDVFFFGAEDIESASALKGPSYGLMSTDQDMLGKMILAMGLGAGRFVRTSIYSFLGPSEILKNFLVDLDFFCPKVVVTLGAKATGILLGAQGRLSRIHGQVVERDFSSGGKKRTIKVVPIFHPTFLEINPSMKRTAWNDLQKVIKIIKDSSIEG